MEVELKRCQWHASSPQSTVIALLKASCVCIFSFRCIHVFIFAQIGLEFWFPVTSAGRDLITTMQRLSKTGWSCCGSTSPAYMEAFMKAGSPCQRKGKLRNTWPINPGTGQPARMHVCDSSFCPTRIQQATGTWKEIAPGYKPSEQENAQTRFNPRSQKKKHNQCSTSDQYVSSAPTARNRRAENRAATTTNPRKKGQTHGQSKQATPDNKKLKHGSTQTRTPTKTKHATHQTRTSTHRQKPQDTNHPSRPIQQTPNLRKHTAPTPKYH